MPFFGVPIRNGLPIGLGSVAGFGVQRFDPSELFYSGAEGAWYDPSDLSTMFDSFTGATPVAMPGQGSAVSVGLMLDKSQGLVLGSELRGNGTLSTIGTVTLGAYDTGTGNGTVNRGATVTDQSFVSLTGLTAQSSYRVNFTVTSGAIAFRVGNSSALPLGVFTGATEIIVFMGASTQISVTANGNNSSATFTGLSVRELPGNHVIAINDTTARPELRARVNLLVATATLSTQNVTTQATSYTLSFAGTGSITLSGTATGSYNAGTHTITCTAGTLTLTVSGTVTTADLRPANSGALLPAYQAVVDANTYDTNGFPLYLRFDGIDDGMYTPANLNLSATDKVGVFAGARKLSDAATGSLVGISTFPPVNNGVFEMFAPGNAGPTYGWRTKGTLDVLQVTGTFNSPITNVVTGLGDISGDLATLRANGVQISQSASDQGTGNYGSYPLYIGARAGTSNFLNGYLYGLTVVGSQLTTPQIESMESWTAGKTGISIP